MAGNTKDAWNEVGDQFADLGRRIAERFRVLGAEGSKTAAEDRKKLDDAVRTITQHLDNAFTSVGDTMRDPAAKESLNKAVQSLGDALAATFSQTGERLRRGFGSERPGSSDAGHSEPSPPNEEKS